MNYTDNYSRISSAGEEILTIHRTGDDAIVTRYLDAVEVSETRMTIAEARKKREIDPTLAVLRACVNEMEGDPQTPAHALKRVKHMLDFIETLTGWYEQVRRLPKNTLIKLMNMGARIARFVGG